MSANSQLAIHLEKFIKAKPSEVWKGLTDPAKFFITFVGVQFVGPFEAGKLVKLDEGLALVEEATPAKRLAIRWNYDPKDAKTFVKDRSTLVEFELIEKDGGTLLKFSETGFENLPQEIRQNSFDCVNNGWPGIFDDFASIAERGEDGWLVAQSYGLVKAPLAKIWDAALHMRIFTHMERYEGEVKVGNVVTIHFGGGHQGLPLLITKVREDRGGRELAFRWHHETTDPKTPFEKAETTQVSIQMMEMEGEGGVWMVFRETEFDNLPSEKRQEIYKQQEKAWEGAVEIFAKTIESGETA